MLDSARTSEWEVVEQYLRNGINPNCVDDEENGITALHIAAYLGDDGFNAMRTLLE